MRPKSPYIILSAFLFALCASGNTSLIINQSLRNAAAGVSYVLDEGFEGTGYENTWTEDNGTPDEDYTTSVQVGSQALFLNGAESTYSTVTDADTYTIDFWFRLNEDNVTSLENLVGIRTSGGSLVCGARIAVDESITVYANGSDATDTVNTVSLNTWYKCRLIWNDSGTCSVEFNASGTFDGTGEDYTSKTGGSTSDAVRIYAGSSSNDEPIVIDDIKVQ